MILANPPNFLRRLTQLTDLRSTWLAPLCLCLLVRIAQVGRMRMRVCRIVARDRIVTIYLACVCVILVHRLLACLALMLSSHRLLLVVVLRVRGLGSGV